MRGRSPATLAVVVLGGVVLTGAGSPAVPPAEPGFRIVVISTLRPAPGISTDSNAVRDVLSQRAAAAPPDGTITSVVYACGGSVRVERSGPGAGRVSILKAGARFIVILDPQARAFTKVPRAYRPAWPLRQESANTGATETVAGLRADELRYTVSELRAESTRDPRGQRPGANLYDGYTDSTSTTTSFPDAGAVAATMAETTGVTWTGRLWLASPPAGLDGVALAEVLIGNPIIRVVGAKLAVSHVWRLDTPRARGVVDFHDVVESIEAVPVDSALFEVPPGYREVAWPMRSRGPQGH